MTEMASHGNLQSRDSRGGSKYLQGLQGETGKDVGLGGAQDSPIQADFGIISPTTWVEQPSHGVHINNIKIQKPLEGMGGPAGVPVPKHESPGLGGHSEGTHANPSPPAAHGQPSSFSTAAAAAAGTSGSLQLL